MQILLKNIFGRYTYLRRLVFERGSILIVTLWTLCFLSAFVIALGYGIRQKINLVRRLDERDKMRYISEAGMKFIISAVLKKGSQVGESTVYSLSDRISGIEVRRINVGDGVCDFFYRYIDEESGQLITQYGLIDEESKININTADQFILRRLCQLVLGLDKIDAQEIAASIVDWRDKDSELSIPLGSAEDSYYRNTRFPYEAKDSNFEVLNELLLVKGISEERYNILRYFVTIYGNGTVNINTASRIILLAFGMKESLADRLILYRNGEDGIPGTEDDNVFGSVREVISKLSQYYHLSSSDIAHLSAILDKGFGTISTCFLVQGIVRLNKSRRESEFECVVNKDGEVLFWHQD